MQIEKFALPASDGIVIKGEIVRPGSKVGLWKKYPALIICHGIPRQRRLPRERSNGSYGEIARFFATQGFLSAIFNFRGTGESSGNFDLWGWQRDLDAVLDLVLKQPSTSVEEVSLLGFSGGAAVACITAAKRLEVKNLLLLACPADFDFLFASRPVEVILREARKTGIIRDEGYPEDSKKWLQEQKSFRPVDYISQVPPRRLLLLHGSKDEVVPLEHAHRLHVAAGETGELVIIEDAPHQLRGYPGILDRCADWLRGREKD